MNVFKSVAISIAVVVIWLGLGYLLGDSLPIALFGIVAFAMGLRAYTPFVSASLAKEAMPFITIVPLTIPGIYAMSLLQEVGWLDIMIIAGLMFVPMLFKQSLATIVTLLLVCTGIFWATVGPLPALACVLCILTLTNLSILNIAYGASPWYILSNLFLAFIFYLILTL